LFVAVSSPLSTLMPAPAAQSLPPRPAPVRHLRKQKWICRINPTIDFPCLRFGSRPLFLGISLELPSFHDFHPTSSWLGRWSHESGSHPSVQDCGSFHSGYLVGKWIADSPCRFMAKYDVVSQSWFRFLTSPDLLASIAFFVTCHAPSIFATLLTTETARH
jgi:hypothetical protein